MTFKKIFIGELIYQRVEEIDIDMKRITNFFNIDADGIRKMYLQESLDTESLLKWCKLLKYDFFRIYSQHLILYAPVNLIDISNDKSKNSKIPRFRKNIYTKEIIDFIINKVQTGKMTKIEIINKYNIPKTTLYKWLNKYK